MLDHLFICVAPDAPERAALTRLGPIEGTPNRHPGQGACRRFLFRNAYLELLWVHDADEARSHHHQARARPVMLDGGRAGAEADLHDTLPLPIRW